MSSLNGAYYSYYIETGFESGDLFKSWLCSFTVTLENLLIHSVCFLMGKTNKQTNHKNCPDGLFYKNQC